jgi:hypothetical protein
MAVAKKDNFITLKEAADMSGYSSDYLGQLIRGGKLEGEQVYMSVAWMTTKEAVEEYVARSKTKKGKTDDMAETPIEIKKSTDFFVEHRPVFFKTALYAVIVMNIAFLILLFHVGSFSVEKRFEQHDQLRQTAFYDRNHIRTLYA